MCIHWGHKSDDQWRLLTECVMNEDAKKIIDRMTTEEQRRGLHELDRRLKLVGATWGSGYPPTSGYEELEEREYLKAKLGH